MKTLRYILIPAFLMVFSPCFFAQNSGESKPVSMDTLITKKNEKLTGKITKVTETDFEYKKSAESDAPLYSVSRDKIKEIRWANGTKEMVRPDEMDVNTEHEILEKRQAIKFHFFSPVSDKILFSYERVLKVGTNLEVSAGIINNTMGLSSTNVSNSSTPLTQGAILCAGVKFLLGQDFYMKGMKYAHPLKGRFIKPEILYSGFTLHGVNRTYYVNNNNGYSYPKTVYSDERVNSIAIMINYGRQFILGNNFTLAYSIGLGYGAASTSYSNSNYALPPNGTYMYNSYSDNTFGNYYSHYRVGPIAYSFTFTMGYLFK